MTLVLSPEKKSLILRIVNAFETGSPGGDYGAVSVFEDGPHNLRQITYGRSQTTEYGNLRELIRDYVQAGGTHAEAFRPYVDIIGRGRSLWNDKSFRRFLREAGQDPVMVQTQDFFFDRTYLDPAVLWCYNRDFDLPLSALVVYDSFIHSGGVLGFLRDRFPERPEDGERKWIPAYVAARHKWLSSHNRPILRKTTYRTRCLTDQIRLGNWDLENVPIIANGVAVFPA